MEFLCTLWLQMDDNLRIKHYQHAIIFELMVYLSKFHNQGCHHSVILQPFIFVPRFEYILCMIIYFALIRESFDNNKVNKYDRLKN
jgi:hypothetical protein